MAGPEEKGSAIRVAIVEDDEGIRASIASLLQHADGFNLAGGYASAEDALARLAVRYCMP